MRYAGAHPAAINRADEGPAQMQWLMPRLVARYGDKAASVARRLYAAQPGQARRTNRNIAQIGPLPGVLERNLKALEYVAQDKANASQEVIERLYQDALIDLHRTYRPDDSPDDPCQAWRHCLDDVYKAAAAKARRYSLDRRPWMEAAATLRNRPC